MQALEPPNLFDETAPLRLERRKHIKVRRLLSGADKRSENESGDSIKLSRNKTLGAKSKSKPETNNFDDLVTPVKVYPGIFSQKRRSSEEQSLKNKDQTNRKQLERKRKPDHTISVKAPRSATKVTTRRLYHIQIPEEGRKDTTWFNAQFNFSVDNNIDWKYEGPIKMKNYLSTSSYK